MKTLLENIYKYFQRSDLLKYIKRIELCQDSGQLVDEGKFPFINFEPESQNIDDITGFYDYAGQRNIYKIIISFATSHTLKKSSIMGEKDFKGIFDVASDINTTIQNYITSVKFTEHITIYKKPVLFQRTWQLKTGKFVTGCELILELKQDDFN